MPSDSIRVEIRGELRALRTMEGELRVERFATLHALVEQLGRGNIDDAFTEFMNLEEEVGRQIGSDLHAYFFTVGVGVGGHNLDDRLKKYVRTYHVVERTAQRRTDRGLERLSHIIRDRSAMFRPEATVILTQNSYIAGFTLILEVPSGTFYALPEMTIDGQKQEIGDIKWGDAEEGTNILRWRFESERIDLRERIDRDPILRLRVDWVAAMRATWELWASLSDPRLFAMLRSEFGRACTIELQWQRPDEMFDPVRLIDYKHEFE